MIWHLHTLWSDHHSKSSNHLSLYKIIRVLLTIFLMLYMTLLWLIYFITGAFNLLIPFTYFNPFYPPHLWKPPIYCLCLWTLIFLGSTYKWETCLSVWLISLSIITSIHPHCHKWKTFIFYGWTIFYCVCMCIYIYIYISAFISSWSIHLLADI